MTRTTFVLAILVALIALAPVAGAATDEPEGSVTTLTEEETGPLPVVVIDDAVADPGEEAWTFRFLIPTALALAGLVVVGVVIAYAFRVKGRYRVAR